MYKLFINGAFVRSESGRSDPSWNGREFGANIARGSRKDVRDAVVAARAAHERWRQAAPSLRGLIVYRLAEMMEARRAEFVELTGDRREVDASIDRVLWYAGWCDKFSALLSTRNPVSGPHFNFSSAEPTGIVALLSPDEPPLLALVSTLLPIVVSGNTAVVIASEKHPRTAMVFAEAVATSDMPAGVVNIITGLRDELAPVLAKHMDVNAMAYLPEHASPDLIALGAENVKRMRAIDPDAESLDEIAAYCEIKTIWHPAGM